MNRKSEIYGDVCVTLQKYAVDKVAALVADHPSLTYFDWDTVSEAHELPDNDLLGPAGLGFIDEGKFFTGVFSFGCSTVNDPNLFRLRQIVSSVYADFIPDDMVPMYRHLTGEAVSWMKVTPPVSVTPITRAVTRPLQFVTVNVAIDPYVAGRL